jgi:hypothetical protein
MPGVDSGVKSALKELFKDTDATELASKLPHEIVPQIADALPNENSIEIAKQLLKFLKDMGFGTTPTSTTKKDDPQRVIVEMPKALADHTIRELLNMLAENKGETSEVLAVLTAKPEVVGALGKANDKIVVPTGDGAIDPQATSDYIKELNLRFSEPQRKVNGKFPVTLDQVLNLTRLVTLNPLTLKVNYVGVKDTFGVVISDLPDERYFALLWALLTDHPRMPRTTDEDEIETYLEQIFADTESLKRRWTVIFEDYAEARRNGDVTAQTLIRQMTEDQAAQLLGRLGGATPSGSTPTPVDYEKVVRAHFAEIAQLRETGAVVRGYSKTVTGKYTSLTISAYDVYVDNAVVIDEMRITKYNVRGGVIMPPHTRLYDSGYNNSVRVTNVTWQEIAERLNLA